MSIETGSVFQEKPTAYAGSLQSTRSEINLFELPPTDITEPYVSQRVPYFPITSLKESYSPLEFIISSDGGGYIDLSNTKLSLLCRVVKSDGTLCTDTDIVAPSNLVFHNLFSNLEVWLNGVCISDSSNFYPTIATITRLLSSNPFEKQHSLKSEFFYPDDAPDHFSTSDDKNPNFKQRYNMTKNSKQFALLGNLVANVFTQRRLFPTGSEFRIILRRNLPELYLDAPSSGKPGFNSPAPYRIQIDEAVLWVSRNPISTAVAQQTTDMLQSGHTLKYPVIEREVKTFTIPQDVTSQCRLNYNGENLEGSRHWHRWKCRISWRYYQVAY